MGGQFQPLHNVPEFITYRTLYHIIEIVVNIQKVALGGDPFRFR